MFNGSIPALITPFAGSAIDEKALTRLIQFHIDNGTNAIVPVGTTGESSTMSHKEHNRVVELVVNEVSGQIPVIAGAGSNNPTEAVAFANHAATVGADAVLHTLGYYNRPNQEGIYQHFKLLNESTALPIIAYNVPSRTIIDILPETMARIATLTNVVGIKDATADLSRPLRERLLIDGDFCFLSGEDPTAVAYNAHGGQGCISVSANVAPALCAQLQQTCAKKQYDQALKIQMQLMPLHRALFTEPSPAGVKYACSLLGLCEPTCRLPIVALRDTTKSTIRDSLAALGLL